MYSKQEASQLRQEFWTTFGKYMAPVVSAEGTKVNWVNYKTGEKHIYFRMKADNSSASIGIEITHPDAGIRNLYFEQFEQLKQVLHQAVGEEWNWVKGTMDDNGISLSKIYTELTGASIFNKADGTLLISFFKPRIIALDEFWTMARYPFESLR